MKRLVECVPNFSEGRRAWVIDEIVAEIESVPGVFVLGRQMDPDHNRSVVTFMGDPHNITVAAFRAIARATQHIDMRTHKGVHPRIGATDVVPFIPVKGVTMKECVDLAHDLGRQLAEELNIPVYFYEEAAITPERKNLAVIRRGEFEGLRTAIMEDPARAPDMGERRLHVTAGATAIGARNFLIAYNIYLDSRDLALARSIARHIRESSGGLPTVKAKGFEIAERGCVQVSANLCDYRKVSLARVFEEVESLAKARGVPVLESEVIGFLPRAALQQAAVERFRLKGFRTNQIIEERLKEVLEGPVNLQEFLSDLASTNATPGGGSAGALVGAVASTLIGKVANLSLGRKSQAEKDAFEEFGRKAVALDWEFQELVRKDAEAFRQVIEAWALPGGTAAEKSRRRRSVDAALLVAAQSALDLLTRALDGVRLANICAVRGNKNLISDTGAAVEMLRAVARGARFHVLGNLKGVKDKKSEAETLYLKLDQAITDLEQAADGVLERVEEAVVRPATGD